MLIKTVLQDWIDQWCPAAVLIDSCNVGDGFSDLMVYFPDGENVGKTVYVEIKNPEGNFGLTKAEKAFSKKLGSAYVVVKTPGDILQVFGNFLETGKLKRLYKNMF